MLVPAAVYLPRTILLRMREWLWPRFFDIVFLFFFSPFFKFCIAVRVWLAPYDDTNPAPLLIKHKHEPKPFRASDGSEQRAAPPLSFYLFCFAWCVWLC